MNNTNIIGMRIEDIHPYLSQESSALFILRHGIASYTI